MKVFSHIAARELETSYPEALDSIERYDWIRKAFLQANVEFVENRLPEVDREVAIKELGVVHSKEYLEDLAYTTEVLGDEDVFLDPELKITPDLWGSAVEASWSLRKTTETALESPGIYFHISRPGSHHAGRSYGLGFCVLNNLAYAAKNSGLRVAIIDFDIHHGNGTEEIFLDDPNVLTASVHQAPFFPGTGWESDASNINVPIKASGDPSADTENWIAGIEKILRGVKDFRPDLILVEAGIDGHAADPTSDTLLGHDAFTYAGGRLAALQAELGVPVVAEVGGGYSEESVLEGLSSLLEGVRNPLNDSTYSSPTTPDLDEDYQLKPLQILEDIYENEVSYIYNTYPYTAWIGRYVVDIVRSKSISFKTLQMSQILDSWLEERRGSVFEKLAERNVYNQAVLYDLARYMEREYIDIFGEIFEEFFESKNRIDDSFFYIELVNTMKFFSHPIKK